MSEVYVSEESHHEHLPETGGGGVTFAKRDSWLVNLAWDNLLRGVHWEKNGGGDFWQPYFEPYLRVLRKYCRTTISAARVAIHCLSAWLVDLDLDLFSCVFMVALKPVSTPTQFPALLVKPTAKKYLLYSKLVFK